MREMATGHIRPNRLSYAVSLALASLVAGNMALAQETQSTGQEAAKADEASVAKVTVVGTRASQQSSIERKKNAATAIDSIVAEDVGALPDRNIGEAISRMSGIALDRGDFGEGISVAVRGNGPELTRVEIDGQGVQSAGSATISAGGDGGRGSEFRQLSSDLIKSVDIVKGSTADMTEGALGGGIIVKTRTGLDFKKPFVSARVAGSQNSLNKKWQPDANLILADKFLDGRLGVLLNASSSRVANEQHQMQVATSANQGYARAIDFDNSPEKTFTFNPSTLNMQDAASSQPTASYPYTSGTGNYNTYTPLEILTKSAAAKTKADCYAAFPLLATTAPSLVNLSSGNRTNAVNVRNNELLTCLNQWNDYTPSLIRNIIRREVDTRQNLDLRADFKVNNELTVYAKGSYNKRKVDNNQLTYSLGGMNVNTAGTFTDSADGVRTANPGSGYYTYASTPTYRSGAPVLTGTVANVDPASVKVDSKHHVTQFSITDGAATTDQLHTEAETISKYLQLGGTFKRGGLTAEFFVGDAKSSYKKADKRVAFNYNYGPATLSVLPSGLWTYNFPAGTNFNQSNPANYSQVKQGAASSAVAAGPNQTQAVPAYTAVQQPLLTQAPGLQFTPGMNDTEERTAKLDLTYATPDSIPFIKRFKSGFNLRDTMIDSWGGGGSIVRAPQGTYGAAGYVPPIYLPPALLRSSFVGCQDTPGSLGAGGNACKYGYNPSLVPQNASYGQVVMTPQQFQDVIAQTMTGNATATSFFNGAKGVGDVINNWTQIDVDKVFALTKLPGVNFDCVKSCTANDGKVYNQPVAKLKERSEALYVMADFGIDRFPFTDRALPFGWELEGNLGYRYIRTKIHGVGNMNFTSIAKTPSFDPYNPNAAGGTTSTTVAQNTMVDATTHDFLPIYNLAMWVVPDQVVLRYNRARTVARPGVGKMLPTGTCIFDERIATNGDADQRCTGTLGNPELQAQKNLNQNWSAEYYPNKDTMFSLAYFKQQGIIGPVIAQGVIGLPLFAGSNVVDPVTGKSLDNLKFDYSTYMNGVAATRKGWEFGSKTAFTFLPWQLRFTGLDVNYTKLASVTSTQNVVDLLTGDKMPPLRESKNSYNWALWYDDGTVSARVAVQAVGTYFTCIAACTANTLNNYPNAFNNQRPLPWNPGSPNFKDSTRFIDGKIGYKYNRNIEFFVEGRNLGNAITSSSQAQYSPFADGIPNLLDYSFSGRRIMVGVNFRN